jgi:hypothetical protein
MSQVHQVLRSYDEWKAYGRTVRYDAIPDSFAGGLLLYNISKTVPSTDTPEDCHDDADQ